MRHRRKISHETRPIAPILGAPFTYRTLHPVDARRDPDATEHTLDRMVTVTLAAIHGLDHHEPVCMMVEL